MNKSGFTLIEVLVSLAILAILLTTFLPLLGWLISRTRATEYDAQASLVLQEAMEVSYNVMAGSWDRSWSVYPAGIYHPSLDVSMSPEKWILVSGNETGVEARFDRKIEILPVCRNQGNGDILPGVCNMHAGTVDDNSKMVVGTVEWKENGRPKSISAQLLVTYLGQ